MKKLFFLLVALLFFSTTKAQIVNIPDANFKAMLLGANATNTIAKNLSGAWFKIDANNDGEIQESEALEVFWLDVQSLKITDLTGILSFNNLTFLTCYNNQLTSLDVASLVNLTSLDCRNNQITSLNVIPLVNLISLQCYNNKLTSLELSSLVNLTYLDCGVNRLTSLEVSSLVNLREFSYSDNKLTSLDVTPLVNLNKLYCENNQLTLLDVSPLVNLTHLACSGNQLTSLDLTPLINLTILACGGNKYTLLNLDNLEKLNYLDCNNSYLTSLNIKNTNIQKNISNNVFDFYFANCKYLKYICADDKDLIEVQKKIDQYSYSYCHVNSYCSFVPGGKIYTIVGNCKLDSDNNGCDITDTNYPSLKISISDGTNNEVLITDLSGNYNINVQAGTFTIKPVLENPYYFTVSPENIVVNFPIETSPTTHNFCLKLIEHTDLEVIILPIVRARPGFDASYTIIYKNKGTQTQSGSVNQTFNDAILDLVVANPLVATQTVNNLSWNFIDLKPFETREITFTVHVNSPMETPAINNDDILNYTSTITSTSSDETPSDNSFTLSQIVVGSFDPNDKTCFEGTTIPPSAVGKYVHYMIRFENKGTAEAENVVIKDMIDTSKFDISSLVVTQGSHPFVTRITETNKVEFIFEKINLPFDDATNDGYVAFKIKTLPTLVVGNSFSNSASIYFDYNFPIVTNTATTSVLQSLGTQDFEFSSYFSVYPNPVKAVLNVDFKKQIELSSISIFNTLGQQILVIPNAQKTKQVDVSSLKTGNYFIKVISNKGSASGMFVKE